MAITYVQDTFQDNSTPDIDETALNKITTALNIVCMAAIDRNSQNLGTLDADLLSGVSISNLAQISLSGLGSYTPAVVTDCNANLLNGIFSIEKGITGWAFNSDYTGVLLHAGGNTNDRVQLAMAAGSSIALLKFRVYTSGAWGTWKNIWTEINDGTGSGLDADTVDGIQAIDFATGKTPTTLNSAGTFASQFTNTIKSGPIIIGPNVTDTELNSSVWRGWITVFSDATNDAVLTLKNTATLGTLGKQRVSGVWSNWYYIWDSIGDGNSGRPPEAKSTKTSSSLIGWFDALDCASGAQVSVPVNGTFAWFVGTYGATYGGAKSGIFTGGPGVVTGTASANLVFYYKRIT